MTVRRRRRAALKGVLTEYELGVLAARRMASCVDLMDSAVRALTAAEDMLARPDLETYQVSIVRALLGTLKGSLRQEQQQLEQVSAGLALAISEPCGSVC